jgi:hypothetical protein
MTFINYVVINSSTNILFYLYTYLVTTYSLLYLPIFIFCFFNLFTIIYKINWSDYTHLIYLIISFIILNYLI